MGCVAGMSNFEFLRIKMLSGIPPMGQLRGELRKRELEPSQLVHAPAPDIKAPWGGAKSDWSVCRDRTQIVWGKKLRVRVDSARFIGWIGHMHSIAIHEIWPQIQTRRQREPTMKGTILDFLNLATEK